MKKPLDRTKYENRFFDNDFKYVIGVDETGRGAGAGPIYASAVIVDQKSLEFLKSIENLRDSKKLSHEQRWEIYEKLINKVEHHVCSVSVDIINKEGISAANRSAMEIAVNIVSGKKKNIALLIDGNMTIETDLEARYLTKGDDRSLVIAAASIIAKVERDMTMVALASSGKYNRYQWHCNMGYLTKVHISAIKEHGPSDKHRKQFIRKFV